VVGQQQTTTTSQEKWQVDGDHDEVIAMAV
jgi:hypothetical protein